MSNHVSYSVLLSLALRALIFCFITGVVTHQSKEIHRRFCWSAAFRISTERPFSPGGFFFGKTLSFHLQLMLSCSVVALLSSLLGLVGLAGLGHHYYHHSPHGSFQWDEVKDWSQDHRHGHSMEAMKQILWWGCLFCFKKMLDFFEADKRYLFLLTLMFSKYVFLLKHVKSTKVAHWDGRTETAQSGCSQQIHVVGSLWGNPIVCFEFVRALWSFQSPYGDRTQLESVLIYFCIFC